MKGCAEVVTNCWRQLYSFTAGLALLAAAVLSWSGSAPRTPEQDYFSCFFKQKSSSNSKFSGFKPKTLLYEIFLWNEARLTLVY